MANPYGGAGLRRNLSLPLLVLYGLGTTVGAGIYALTGEIAGRAGMLAFASFGAAAILAGFSAISYAALSSRYPFAAAQAVFVHEAFERRRLAAGVALAIAISGAVSAAAVCNGFVGYVNELIPVSRPLALVAISVLLGGVASLGVRPSVGAAATITAIEIGGLLLVVAFAAPALLELPERAAEFSVASAPAGWTGVFAGTFLAFYAFLGFEDMVNVGEEVRDARRVLPLAIALTLGLTLVLYALLAVSAVLVVPPTELSASGAPLALVFERSGGHPRLLGVIGVLAMLNGALIQIIMASRILFGLARDGSLPHALAFVHPRTQAPLTATASIAVLVCALGLAFPIARLAETSSLITLSAFVLVNASLIRIQRRIPAADGALVVPQALPWLGLFASLGMLVGRWVSGVV